MAIIRMREVIAVGRTGVAWEGPNDYTFGLGDLYGMTTPQEWEPELSDLGSWAADTYELGRDAAERITTSLNDSEPWES